MCGCFRAELGRGQACEAPQPRIFVIAILKPCLRRLLIWIKMGTLEVCALGSVHQTPRESDMAEILNYEVISRRKARSHQNLLHFVLTLCSPKSHWSKSLPSLKRPNAAHKFPNLVLSSPQKYLRSVISQICSGRHLLHSSKNSENCHLTCQIHRLEIP